MAGGLKKFPAMYVYIPELFIMWYVDPLLGNDRERSSYTTAVTE
jgi:hypothetical protein